MLHQTLFRSRHWSCLIRPRGPTTRPMPRHIVEKAIKATGQKPGDKVTGMTWKDKGKFTAAGMAMDYTGDFAFQGPDKYRTSVNADVEGMKLTFIAIANGGKGWESALGMTQEVTAEKLEYIVNQTYVLHVTSLLPLLADKEFKLATAGEKDVNGKKAAAVTVTRDKKPTVTLYFDKDTGLARQERDEGEGRVPGVEGSQRGELLQRLQGRGRPEVLHQDEGRPRRQDDDRVDRVRPEDSSRSSTRSCLRNRDTGVRRQETGVRRQ